MPIPFTCPQCGHYTMVADAFAGKTGPCSACRAEVTVPLVLPKKRGGNVGVWVGLLVSSILLFCIAVMVGFAFFSVSKTIQPQAMQLNNINRMRALGVAMHNYHDVYGAFPPAAVMNDDGAPQVSWRTLLLPYVGRQPLYGRVNLGLDWDDPANGNVRNTAVPQFQADGIVVLSPLETHYLLLTGEGTAFPGGKSTSLDELERPANQVALAVLVQSLGVEWSEPEDLPVEDLPEMLRSGVVTDSLGMVSVLMADGTVQQLDLGVATRSLAALTQIKDSANSTADVDAVTEGMETLEAP